MKTCTWILGLPVSTRSRGSRRWLVTEMLPVLVFLGVMLWAMGWVEERTRHPFPRGPEAAVLWLRP